VSSFTESVVEQAALAWLESIGWRIAHGPDIAPDMPAAERRDYSEVVLPQRLLDALARLNPDLPAEALEDAFRKLTRPDLPAGQAGGRGLAPAQPRAAPPAGERRDRRVPHARGRGSRRAGAGAGLRRSRGQRLAGSGCSPPPASAATG